MSTLTPFANETDSMAIGDLTIENRIDQLELYGALSITRDKAGLARALQLQAVLAATVAHLQAVSDLPEQITFRPTDSVNNPFK